MQREKLWTPEFLGMGGSNLFLFMSQYIMVAALPISSWTRSAAATWRRASR